MGVLFPVFLAFMGLPAQPSAAADGDVELVEQRSARPVFLVDDPDPPSLVPVFPEGGQGTATHKKEGLALQIVTVRDDADPDLWWFRVRIVAEPQTSNLIESVDYLYPPFSPEEGVGSTDQARQFEIIRPVPEATRLAARVRVTPAFWLSRKLPFTKSPLILEADIPPPSEPVVKPVPLSFTMSKQPLYLEGRTTGRMMIRVSPSREDDSLTTVAEVRYALCKSSETPGAALQTYPDSGFLLEADAEAGQWRMHITIIWTNDQQTHQTMDFVLP